MVNLDVRLRLPYVTLIFFNCRWLTDGIRTVIGRTICPIENVEVLSRYRIRNEN